MSLDRFINRIARRVAMNKRAGSETEYEGKDADARGKGNGQDDFDRNYSQEIRNYQRAQDEKKKAEIGNAAFYAPAKPDFDTGDLLNFSWGSEAKARKQEALSELPKAQAKLKDLDDAAFWVGAGGTQPPQPTKGDGATPDGFGEPIKSETAQKFREDVKDVEPVADEILSKEYPTRWQSIMKALKNFAGGFNGVDVGAGLGTAALVDILAGRHINSKLLRLLLGAGSGVGGMGASRAVRYGYGKARQGYDNYKKNRKVGDSQKKTDEDSMNHAERSQDDGERHVED